MKALTRERILANKARREAIEAKLKPVEDARNALEFAQVMQLAKRCVNRLHSLENIKG
jgi:hypothetical protein|tara:strand:- start:278 stop:451 length:174 start_codon:yes stop_codon:yes gene_type:complete